ncbi:MAG: energy transducer TonB [Desulfomonilaceae bacterium]
MTIYGAFSETLFLDHDDPASTEGIALDLFSLDFASYVAEPGNTPRDFVHGNGGKKEIEVDFPSPDSSLHAQVTRHPLFGSAAWTNSRGEFERDLLSIDLEPDGESAGKPEAEWFASRSPRPLAFFTSALAHFAVFFLFTFFPAIQGAGSTGNAGNVISVRITAQEDLVPQDESPASVDSAASAPSTAGKNKKQKELRKAQSLEQPADARDPGPQPQRKAMIEKPKPLEEKEELEKEIIKKNDRLDTGDGPQNSMASIPSIASAERRFIPAAGQDGEAFQSRVLSAIREAIFFPKQAVKDRQHGEVVVMFAINKDGSISSLQVTKPSGSPILDEAAIKIIQKAAAKFPAIPDSINKQSMDYVVPILFKEKRG